MISLWQASFSLTCIRIILRFIEHGVIKQSFFLYVMYKGKLHYVHMCIYYKAGHLFNVLTKSNEVHFTPCIGYMSDFHVSFAAAGYFLYRACEVYYFEK